MLKTHRLMASGGVIFRKVNDEFGVALCFKRREKVWCLPKGLIEKDESAEETALREVKEETGLNGEIVAKIGEIHYSFFRGQQYFKTVHFYLLKYVSGFLSDHSIEVEDVRWFKLSEALRVLAYAKEKRILKKAEKMLKTASL
ncbi:MAG: NUDIX hydrolase [Candidatus Bathyarchaeia archaeon]